MNNREYVLLGLRVNVNIGGERVHIYGYEVPSNLVARTRTLLYNEKIPHCVNRLPKGTGLLVYVTDRSEKLENELGARAKQLSISANSEHVISLISSATRIRFIELGWKRAIGKMYNTGIEDGSYVNGLIKLYRTVKIATDNLPSGEKILLLDPALKIEFTSSLREIRRDRNYSSLVRDITWVKLRGHMTPARLYLLDEPLAGLDLHAVRSLMKLIRGLNRDRGLTFLIVEHRLDLLMEIADFIYVLHNGVLLSSGTPSEIVNDPKVMRAYMGE